MQMSFMATSSLHLVESTALASQVYQSHCEPYDTGEPDAAKVARPVRRGADGKVFR